MPDTVSVAVPTRGLVGEPIACEFESGSVRRRSFLFMAAATVAGCASPHAERLSGASEGAVITPICLLRDEIPIYDVGTTVFQNRVRAEPVPEWGFAAQVQSLVTARIRAKSRYWATNGGGAEDQRRLRALLPVAPNGRADLGLNLAGVASMARQMKIDYLLVIDSEPLRDPFFDTNQVFSGQGVYQRSHFSFRAGINFLVARASFIDTANASIVASRTKWQFTPRDLAEWVETDSASLPASVLEGAKMALNALADEVVADLLRGLAVA